jgi:hypothetical protein
MVAGGRWYAASIGNDWNPRTVAGNNASVKLLSEARPWLFRATPRPAPSGDDGFDALVCAATRLFVTGTLCCASAWG